MTLCYYDNNLLVVCVIRFFKNASSLKSGHSFFEFRHCYILITSCIIIPSFFIFTSVSLSFPVLMGLKLCVVRLLTAIILFLPSVIQASNVLVAGTEFSASQRKGVDYVGVDWVDQIGLLGGEFSVFVPLADNVDVDVPTGMSAFHNECHYAVTTNPMILDSAAYKSDTSGNGYMVVSPAKNSIAVFSYVVTGLKPNTLVTVKMGVANLINPLGIVGGMRVDASSLLNVTLFVNGVALRETNLQAGKNGEMVADKGVADAKGEAVVTVMMSSSPSTVLGVDYLRVYLL